MNELPAVRLIVGLIRELGIERQVFAILCKRAAEKKFDVREAS